MKQALTVLGSIILGFLLMIPLGILFDRIHWPLLSSGALKHGSFLLAWPILMFGSFAALQWIFAGRRTPPK